MSDDMSLQHHGIKGQKWGIRRFQNEDGTRTAAGKAREKDAREREAAGSGSLFKSNKSSGAEKYREAHEAKKKAFQESRASFIANKTTGQKVANFMINGPIGAALYNNLRASGNSVFVSEGAVVAASLMGGPLGQLSAYMLTKNG